MRDRVRLLHTAHALAQTELDDTERRFGIDLQRGTAPRTHVSEEWYAQFAAAIRQEAQQMAANYELFYCLENTMRDIVREQLRSRYGDAWWEAHVPAAVRDNVTALMQRERDAAVTPRSADPLDYTTFGELGEVIRPNWEIFGAIFTSQRALERVLAGLNTLRGPIAHCSPLAEDEVLRLRLAVRDLFRQMS
jgi:HEPN superfamily Swt1-like protein